MIGNPSLTGVDSRQLLTYPGQAHFADPTIDHVCRECVHWASKGKRDRAKILAPARCLKALPGGPEVPASARACKHFEENPYAHQA